MKFFYFLSLAFCLIVFSVGCSLNKSTAPTPLLPSGTFTGQFTYYHIHSNTGIIDTLKSNLVLNLDPTTGYKITGDTSTLHAGSYGSYVFSSDYSQIEFLDKTFVANTVPLKIHLSGVYQYHYDGASLNMVGYSPLDTASYVYSFKKSQ